MLPENTFRDLPPLETERLILRKPSVDDAQYVFEYASNAEVARYVTWTPHQSIENSIEFLNMVIQSGENKEPKESVWGIVLKESGKVIGTCGFIGNPAHASAEIGYAIGEPYWGKGLMTEAVREMIRFGFEQLNLNRIEARCMPENIASARVMEKNGMNYEGTMREQMYVKGQFDDLKMYSILRREYFDGTNRNSAG